MNQQAENNEREDSIPLDELFVQITLPARAVRDLLRAREVSDVPPEAIAAVMAAVKGPQNGHISLLPPPRSEHPLPPRPDAAHQKKLAAEAERRRQLELFGPLLSNAQDIQVETLANQANGAQDVVVKKEASDAEMGFPLLDDLEVAIGHK